MSGEVYTDRWGSFVSSYAPVFAANGSVECFVGIDMDAATYQAHLRAVDAATGLPAGRTGPAFATGCPCCILFAPGG